MSTFVILPFLGRDKVLVYIILGLLGALFAWLWVRKKPHLMVLPAGIICGLGAVCILSGRPALITWAVTTAHVAAVASRIKWNAP